MKYPVYQPDLSGNEKKYVNECLDSGWISSKGHFVKEFEQAFCDYTGSKYATSVFNCTVGLHLIGSCLGLGQGDEVICPTFTYVASANPFKQLGCDIIFVNSEPDSWQMDPEDVIAKITPRTKAIVVVHLYGNPVDMEKIIKVAHSKGIFLIEDCAEALGTKYFGQHVGTFGDAACFSFFGNKTITCGEGGMVVCKEPKLYERLLHKKAQGVVQWKEYWHDVVAFNYRMTNIQAAIGLAQLEKINSFLDRKKEIVKRYIFNLKNTPLQFLQAREGCECSYWMVSCTARTEDERNKLREYLRDNGVETRPTFPCIHLMPIYNHNYKSFDVAEDISCRGLNLPSFPGLSDNNIDEICNLISQFYGA